MTLIEAIPSIRELSPSDGDRCLSGISAVGKDLGAISIADLLSCKDFQVVTDRLVEVLLPIVWEQTFFSAVPSLEGCKRERLPQFSTRLQNCCRNEGIEIWEQVMPLRPADVRGWRNAGAKTVSELFTAAISRGLRAAVENPASLTQAATTVEHRKPPPFSLHAIFPLLLNVPQHEMLRALSPVLNGAAVDSPVGRLLRSANRQELVSQISELLRAYAGANKIREIGPLLEDWSTRPLPVLLAGTRLRNCWEREGLKTWADLLEITPQNVRSWPAAGAKTVREQLEIVCSQNLDAALEMPGADPAAAVVKLTDALQTLAAWGANIEKCVSFRAALDLARDGRAIPSPVAAALDALSSIPLHASVLDQDIEEDEEFISEARTDPVTSRLIDSVRAIAESTAISDRGVSLMAVMLVPDDEPGDVSSSVNVLLRSSSDELAGDRVRSFDAILLAEELLRGVEPRERTIVMSREPRLKGVRPKLEELGTKYGVSRQRIDQIEAKEGKRIRDLLDSDRFETLRLHVEELRRVLGLVCHVDDVPAIARPALASDEMAKNLQAASLLVWLAGPYRLYGNWLVRSASRDLLERAEQVVLAAMRDDVLGIEEARQALRRIGFRDERWRTWLEEHPKFRIFEEMVARWGGSQADKAALILRLHGSPLSSEEIFEEISEDRSFRGMTNQLFADERFVRSGKKRFALAEWGVDEFTNIREHMAEELDKVGGEAKVSDLVSAIVKRFSDISPNSIRMYSESPHFVKIGDGKIRLRRTNEPYITKYRIELTRDCFFIDGHWAHRVEINDDHLRGSGFPMREAFACLLGIRPGERGFKFSSPFGDISASWPSNPPTFGSIRGGLTERGIGKGDLVFFRCVPPGSLDVRHFSATELSRASTEEAARSRVGSSDRESDLLSVLAYAVGLTSADKQIPSEVIERLNQRKESDLAALVESSKTMPIAAGLSRVIALAEAGETPQVEFKQTLEWGIRQEKRIPELAHAVTKTVAAFLNTDGGELLIGVSDDGEATGLEFDYNEFQNRDKFTGHLSQQLSKHFGDACVAEHVKTTIVEVDGHDVCHVSVTPAPEPQYVKKSQNDIEFYVRRGTASPKLTLPEALKYIADHFG